MVKNEKGITLLMLSVTIIVLLILASVTINTGYNVLINVRAGRVISNLNLVKIKEEAIYDNYKFSEDEGLLVGNICRLSDIVDENDVPGIMDEIPNYMDEKSKPDWYEWDETILKQQGLDTSILKDCGKIYVNYKANEIIYTAGATMDNKNYHYTLTAIEKAFEEL